MKRALCAPPPDDDCVADDGDNGDNDEDGDVYGEDYGDGG